MADQELAARLAAHEHAFEGLLDLIPAKFYNPEDAANQWNKRKQTKEEQVKAKRAKLDPEQNSRQTKKKDASELADDTAAQPRANGKKAKVKQPAKVKKAKEATQSKAKVNGKTAARTDAGKSKATANDLAVPSLSAAPGDEDEMSMAASPLPSSTSAEADTINKPDPDRNIADLRAKLAAKIEALRIRRKAPGTESEGAPRSRQAILEARRKKEQARAAKKKLEKQARKDAALEIQQEETIKSESDSGSDDDEDDEEQAQPNGHDTTLSYGKLTFADGDALTSTFDTQGARKRKHQDAKSALEAALNKRKRLSGLDDEKKQAIKESDAWHKALLQADGEKLKDDVGLLKKAVKRQEATKKKSEKEWKARLSSIALAKKNKQKTREKNLKERREAKGQKGGHKKTKPVGHKGKGKGAAGKKKGF